MDIKRPLKSKISRRINNLIPRIVAVRILTSCFAVLLCGLDIYSLDIYEYLQFVVLDIYRTLTNYSRIHWHSWVLLDQRLWSNAIPIMSITIF